jgi:threonyl-tRNA synthetase
MAKKSRELKISIDTLRHSCAHVLAQAVLQLYPDAKIGIGPAIVDGFYYDFDVKTPFTPKDLSRIEKEMKKIIARNLPFQKKILSVDEAIKFFKKIKQSYKIELIEDLAREGEKNVTVYQTVYQNGGFIDLCRGPHINSTGQINIKVFKLIKSAGAYWKGDETKPMLQRIYGTAFLEESELQDYLKLQEEIKKRDHRELNKKLKLYGLNDEVGSGLALWLPRGAQIREIIENFWKEEHKKRGYLYVYTPHIGNLGLWKRSGHFEFYRENMYSPIEIDKTNYLLKPMNCPFHVQIFKSEMRSYRDLPLRLCELGTVYRYERPGTLHGLLRVRGFTQDDAHIFCRPNQLDSEIKKVIDLALFMLKSFGFKKFEMDLSLRDPQNKKKYLGDDDAVWQKAEKALEQALASKKLKYKKALGEAVFYGPKIDIKLVDSLGRTWQGPTIQVDFNFPEKFDLNYNDEKGKKQKAVLVHRTVLGSMERFLGCLIEHYGGALPLWLSPIQVVIIPVSEKYKNFAKKKFKVLESGNVRVFLDERKESVGKKISDAQKLKIPYMIVLGEKEIKSVKLPIKVYGKEKLIKMELKKFIDRVKKEIKQKK